jgi:hypothetical protein
MERVFQDAQNTASMVGTWSHNPANEEWFGFWGAEIVTTLSLLQTDLSTATTALGIATGTINSRISTHADWLIANTRKITLPDMDDFVLDDSYTVDRIREVDLPRRVEISYDSVSRNGEQDTRAVERRAAKGKKVKSLRTNLTMDAGEATESASRTLSSEWAGRNKIQFKQMDRTVQPGDVFRLNRAGRIHAVQCEECELGADGDAKIKVRDYDPSIYTQIIPLIADPQTAVTIQPTPGTIGVLLEIPLLRDQDDLPGYYTYAVSTGGQWSGASLLTSADDVIYNNQVTYAALPPQGPVTQGGLSNAKMTTIEDNTSVVRITTQGGQLSSITHDQMLNGENLALIGSEIVNFETVVLVSENTYDISGFLRCRFGTESQSATHTLGETFVLLDGSVVSVNNIAAVIGSQRYYKAVSFGQQIADVQSTQFTFSSNRLKPHAVVHAIGKRLQSGDISVSWIRQTRYNAAWRDFVDAPIGEQTEAYRAKLEDSVGDVKAILDITLGTSAVFSAAQVLAAYGTSDPAVIYVRVSQISTVVGEGHPTVVQF